jgi:hypothetical protein
MLKDDFLIKSSISAIFKILPVGPWGSPVAEGGRGGR